MNATYIKLKSNTNLLALLGLSTSLIVPSTAIIQKYSDLISVLLYVIVSTFILFIIANYISTRKLPSLSDKQFLLLIGILFTALIFIFFIVYPLANSGILGKGSDRDEALNIAIEELMAGHYPYYAKTYLDHPISPLPGSLLLASPFAILGNSAYQNFFWLFLFLITTKFYFQSKKQFRPLYYKNL